MMKKTILMTLFLVTAFCLNQASAQEYDSAIGLRFGIPLSVSYKAFVSDAAAFEVIGGTRTQGAGTSRRRWLNVGAAYQIHQPVNIDGVDGLNYYYGFGGSIYFWTFDDAFTDRGSSTSFGIQGYLGLSYSLGNAPINFTLDWVPTFFLNGYNNGFGADYGGLGIRYIIGQ